MPPTGVHGSHQFSELLDRIVDWRPECISIDHFFCIAHGIAGAELTVFAVSAYAMFYATSQSRGSSPPQASCEYDMQEEFCNTALSGHTPSSAVLSQAICCHLMGAHVH